MPNNANAEVHMHALMAGHGDCLWLSYGDPLDPTRILIDGGTRGTFSRLSPLLDDVRTDGSPSHALLVVTHVDLDHIDGVLPLINSQQYAAQFNEVWFNGREHLNRPPRLAPMGAKQGELLTDAIIDRDMSWNAAFNFDTIVVNDPLKLPRIPLPGGATATLLSPGWKQLDAMAKAWDDEIAAAGLKAGKPAKEPLESADGLEPMGASMPDIETLLKADFDPDKSPANGSSIALLLEYRGIRILLGADAHPDMLCESVRSLLDENGVLHVDVFKLPHHGSRRNVTPDLLALVKADTYIFSTNGAYHKHPDEDAVARVIASAPKNATLIFNCKTKYNDMWDSARLKRKWEYSTVYGDGDNGVAIDLQQKKSTEMSSD